MDIKIIAFESRLLCLVLILYVRGCAEGVCENVLLLSLNAKCIAVVVKICGKEVCNGCTAA